MDEKQLLQASLIYKTISFIRKHKKSMGSTKFTTFAHPQVRDLAWAIGSSVLLEDPYKKLAINIIDNQWVEDRITRHWEWLKEIDRYPQILDQFLEKKSTALIGKYFEALLEFWFTHHTDFELVLANAQIKESHATLGEIDFIIRDSYSEELYHLEVACKYYYSHKESNNWNEWWGPNHQDRLSIKMDKFKQQVALLKLKTAKELLLSLGLKAVPSAVLLKGYFFYPFQNLQHTISPRLSAPHHNAGWFAHLNDLPLLAQTGKQWCVLPKNKWLAPYYSKNNELPILSGKDMVEQLFSEREYTTKLIAQVLQDDDGCWQENSRALIV